MVSLCQMRVLPDQQLKLRPWSFLQIEMPLQSDIHSKMPRYEVEKEPLEEEAPSSENERYGSILIKVSVEKEKENSTVC